MFLATGLPSCARKCWWWDSQCQLGHVSPSYKTSSYNLLLGPIPISTSAGFILWKQMLRCSLWARLSVKKWGGNSVEQREKLKFSIFPTKPEATWQGFFFCENCLSALNWNGWAFIPSCLVQSSEIGCLGKSVPSGQVASFTWGRR